MHQQSWLRYYQQAITAYMSITITTSSATGGGIECIRGAIAQQRILVQDMLLRIHTTSSSVVDNGHQFFKTATNCSYWYISAKKKVQYTTSQWHALCIYITMRMQRLLQQQNNSANNDADHDNHWTHCVWGIDKPSAQWP